MNIIVALIIGFVSYLVALKIMPFASKAPETTAFAIAYHIAAMLIAVALTLTLTSIYGALLP